MYSTRPTPPVTNRTGWRPTGNQCDDGRMQGPLSGIRVLDFTRVLAGPHATLMMADMGAEVIKVEPPAGDVTRFQSPRRNGMASYFVQQNIGKRCISVDLSTPDGVELVLELAEHCDVLIENYRAGVMDKLGLSYDIVAARNPNIIYASISGYGQTGPWKHRRAYAPVVGAEVGLTKSQGDQRGGVYQNDRHSHADTYTALECATAVCAALFNRTRTGTGDRIDISMSETLLYVNEHTHDDLWDGDVDPNWVRSFGNDRQPFARLADGSWAIIASNPAIRGAFEQYLEAMGRQDLADDPRFLTPADRLANFDDLIEIITEYVATVPDIAALEAAFAAVSNSTASLAVGQLRSVADIADSDWAEARGAIRSVPDRGDGELRIPNVPWRFNSSPDVGTRADAPRYRGEDNAEVLHDVLGMSDDRIASLAERGVISDHLPSNRGS